MSERTYSRRLVHTEDINTTGGGNGLSATFVMLTGETLSWDAMILDPQANDEICLAFNGGAGNSIQVFARKPDGVANNWALKWVNNQGGDRQIRVRAFGCIG